jgi:large repetitive protein
MPTQIGIVKEAKGSVIAVDNTGAQRVLRSGDVVFEGETVKTVTLSSKAIINMNDSKEVTILGNDSLSLNEKNLTDTFSQGGEVADVEALQKALLNGKDIQNLEETAAGGAANAGGEGVSLGSVNFLQGGHTSNVNSNYNNIDALNSNNYNPSVLDSGSSTQATENLGSGGSIDGSQSTANRTVSPTKIVFVENTNDLNDNYDRSKDLQIQDGKIIVTDAKFGDKIVTDKGDFVVTNQVLKDGYLEVKGVGSAKLSNYLNDEYLNKAELERNGRADDTLVKIYFGEDVKEGDTLTLSINGVNYSKNITSEDIANKSTNVLIPVNEGEINISASITNAYGTGKSVENNITVDTRAGATSTLFLEDANKDNILSAKELVSDRNSKVTPYAVLFHQNSGIQDNDTIITETIGQSNTGKLQTNEWQDKISNASSPGIQNDFVSDANVFVNSTHLTAKHTIVDKAGNISDTSEQSVTIENNNAFISIDNIDYKFDSKGKFSGESKVTGHIENSNELDGVKLELQDSNGNKYEVTTDQNGNFSFDSSSTNGQFLGSLKDSVGNTLGNHGIDVNGKSVSLATSVSKSSTDGNDVIYYTKGWAHDGKNGTDTLIFDEKNSLNFDGFKGGVKNIEHIYLNNTKINLDINDLLDMKQSNITIRGTNGSSVKLSGLEEVSDTSSISNYKSTSHYFTDSNNSVIVEVHNNINYEL